MQQLSQFTRHRCFISYHHDDEVEVEEFITDFDHGHDIFISRGIGASMPGDVINSSDSDYIMNRVRQLYLNDSTITIVMVGRWTWSRRFVDWEVAASLRNTPNSRRNGLVAIALPSVERNASGLLPPRVSDNVQEDLGYARFWVYPRSTQFLAEAIETAFVARSERDHLVDNSRMLYSINENCGSGS